MQPSEGSGSKAQSQLKKQFKECLLKSFLERLCLLEFYPKARFKCKNIAEGFFNQNNNNNRRFISRQLFCGLASKQISVSNLPQNSFQLEHQTGFSFRFRDRKRCSNFSANLNKKIDFRGFEFNFFSSFSIFVR